MLILYSSSSFFYPSSSSSSSSSFISVFFSANQSNSWFNHHDNDDATTTNQPQFIKFYQFPNSNSPSEMKILIIPDRNIIGTVTRALHSSHTKHANENMQMSREPDEVNRTHRMVNQHWERTGQWRWYFHWRERERERVRERCHAP